MADNKLELVIAVDADKANASIKSVNTALSSLETTAVNAARGASRGVDGMTASMTRAVIAGQAIYDALVRAARSLAGFSLGAFHAADELGKTAQKVGVGVEQFSALKHAAELSGVSMETLTASLARFAANIASAARGSEEQARAFARLGVSVRDTAGTVRPVHEVLTQVAERIAAMPDGTIKTARAMELFGRSGREMIPLLNQGAAGLREMSQEARELGILVGESFFRGAEAFNDNLRRLRAALQGLSFEVGRLLLPTLLRWTNELVSFARGLDREQLVVRLKEIAEWTKIIATTIAGYKLAQLVRSLAMSFGALNAALLANPWGLAAVGITALGVAVQQGLSRIRALNEGLTETAQRSKVLAAIRGGATLEQLKQRGFDEERVRAALRGRTVGTPETFEVTTPVSVRQAGMMTEADEVALKRIAEAQKRAAEIRRQAQLDEVNGMARILAQHEEYRRELGLSRKANEDLAEAVRIRLRVEGGRELRAAAAERVKQIEQEAADRARLDADRMLRDREFHNETLELAQRTARQRLESEQAAIEQAREAQLRSLELVDARTIEEKVAVEQQKLAIEQDYLRRRFELRAAELRREADLEIQTMEIIARARGISEEIAARRRAAIEESVGVAVEQLEAETQAAVQAARENAAIRQAQIIRDQNRQIFESFKRQAEGVFDALLTRSRSIWQAIADSLKTALLTAIKEIVTSRVAAVLMQLFAGMRVPVTAGGAGRLAAVGALGALPAFGAAPIFGGAGPIPGGAAGGWGTPPFIPGGAGGLGGLGGWLRAGGWMDLATAGGLALMLGGLARRNAALTILGASLGLARLGIMGTQLGMVGGAGAGLALAGLMRGGPRGLAMSAAGGAILGWQFGGPLGAAIGAGIGAIAGIARLFVKSAEEKAREKIRATYGVDIRDKAVLRQIVETAKQAFGGNLDAAIRSQQIRDLIELYAMATGQSTAGLPPTMRPVSLLQQGGALYQQTFTAGAAPRLDRIAAGTPQAASPIVINITVPGAKEFFENETLRVVVDNPRAVQSSTLAAARANAGRREMAALQLSPGLITS